MSSFVIGSFRALLGIDSSGYTSGILSAQAVNAAFGQSFANFVANPIAGSIGLLRQAGSAFIGAAKGAADYGESMALSATKANLAVTTFQALREELLRSGENAEGLSDQMRAFGNTLDAAKNQGGAAATAFQRIGLDPTKITQSDAGIREVLEALSRVPVEAGRGAIAQDLFGRSGAALANAVASAGGSVQGLVDKYTRFGLVLDDTAIKKLVKFDGTLDTVGQTIDGVSRKLSTSFFSAFSEAFGGLDESGQGAKNLNDALVPLASQLGTIVGWLVKLNSELSGTLGWIEKIRQQEIDKFTKELTQLMYSGPSAAELARPTTATETAAYSQLAAQRRRSRAAAAYPGDTLALFFGASPTR